MADITAVIFDIGNVLIEWQPERYYDAKIGKANRVKLFAETDVQTANERSDMGEDMGVAIRESALKHPEWHDEIIMWHEKWIELAAPDIPHSVRLLRALRAKGVPVFSLTNFGMETFEVARVKYDFLNEFDRQFISGHMKVIKPDPRIYEMVEQDCGLDPSTLLFADDRIENIEAAQARGWQGHIFTDSQGWADRLVAEGLLNADQAQ